MSLCSLSNKMESKEENVLFPSSLLLWDIHKQREGKTSETSWCEGTRKLNLSSVCQAGGAAIMASLTFAIPVNCWGDICVSPASRESSHLTGNWRKIKGQGSKLGIRQNYPPAGSVTVHFCFPLGELLVFFRIVHLNFRRQIASKKITQFIWSLL